MSFQSNYGGGNSNNQQQDGEKKKTNFPLGRFYGSDGLLVLSIWLSQSSVNTIFQIKQSVGKDPGTGMNVFENKGPTEMPRIFLKPDQLRVLLEAMKTRDSVDYTPNEGNSRITITGIKSGDIKITIAEKKHPQPRVITFPAVPVGDTNVQNGNWANIIQVLQIALDRALLIKLNPDSFTDANPAAADDELPI